MIEGGVECDISNLDSLLILCFTMATIGMKKTFFKNLKKTENVKLRIGSLKISSWKDLEQFISGLKIHDYVNPLENIQIRVQSTKNSKLFHTQAIKERINKIMTKKFDINVNYSENENDENDEIQLKTLFVRISEDNLEASISVAQKLYKRNPIEIQKWVAIAPMRETIACSLLESIQMDIESKNNFLFHKDVLIWDPFCGSGTILTEAARVLKSSIINDKCRIDILKWPVFNKISKLNLTEKKDLPVNKAELHLWGCDIDKKAIESSVHNFQVFFEHSLNDKSLNKPELHLVDFEKCSTLISNSHELNKIIISNLPYGHRLDDPKTEIDFRRLGNLLKKRQDIKNVYFLNGKSNFAKLTQIKWKPLLTFKNRGIPVQFLKMIR